MRFLSYIAVMQALAKMPGGGTVGQIQRYNPHMTRGQGERVLRSLEKDGLVIVEAVAYRPNINKRVYHLTPKAVEYCECVVVDFDSHEHQKGLFDA